MFKNLAFIVFYINTLKGKSEEQFCQGIKTLFLKQNVTGHSTGNALVMQLRFGNHSFPILVNISLSSLETT